MPATKYKSHVLSSRLVAEKTQEFTFERPAGFDFRAGQAIDLELIHPAESDPRGNSHTFSIASAPSEERLRIASRMRDTAFKRSLHSLTPGSEIAIEGPSGGFRLHQDHSRPAALIAGGIGVTPFMSMIAETLHNREQRELWLFCCNRRPGDIPFADELRTLASKRPSFHLVTTITRPDPSDASWKGDKGPISEALLRRHLKDLRKPFYYLAGPPGFVEATNEALLAAKIPDTDIRSEEFSGY